MHWCQSRSRAAVPRHAVRSRARPAARLLAAALGASLALTTAAAQRPDELPLALRAMAEAERTFAADALHVGWKEAFRTHLAPNAVGFERGQPGLAHEQVRAAPDPPPDLQLRWEPRLGDVAGSGDLGYLTGPMQTVRGGEETRPRHSTYVSVWKRQDDATFRVVLNIGLPTTGAAPFPAELTRAAHAGRFTGDYDETTPPLNVADGVMNSALRSSEQVRAYRGRLAASARLYRANTTPLIGEADILRYLGGRPAMSAIDTRYAETARSGDLGYTFGTFTVGRQQGSYVRIWVRERTGQWLIALDAMTVS